MRSTIRAIAALASAALIAPCAAQTWSNCNPLLRSGCPADSALGRTVNIDFRSASDSFTPQGNPTYGADGVSFTVAKSGDSPQLTSKWYIMFGKVDIWVKAAPGAGIVSSFVLQSDDLDEIDWEWLGADGAVVQTNYFGKGQTTTYDRGAFHANPGNQADYHKYTIDWTPQQIVWQIDDTTVRTLVPANANNQYPQTPMQVKFGAWSGGDPANSQGTIQWAHGPTDYSKGPYTMKVKSIAVQDYSTGSSYTYGDSSGTWQSIRATGGTIFSGGNKPIQPAPAVSAPVQGQPQPFSPQSGGLISRPATQPSASYSNYPGLPSGWTVSNTGKVVPPASAAPTALPSGSPAASCSDSVLSTRDGNGRTSLVTVRPTACVNKNPSGTAVPVAPVRDGASSLLAGTVVTCTVAFVLGASLLL